MQKIGGEVRKIEVVGVAQSTYLLSTDWSVRLWGIVKFKEENRENLKCIELLHGVHFILIQEQVRETTQTMLSKKMNLLLYVTEKSKVCVSGMLDPGIQAMLLASFSFTLVECRFHS